MKLAILGATGNVGRLILQAALAADHEVTICVRDPGKLAIEEGRFRVVVGPIADTNVVFDAVRGADAVISAIGGGEGTLATLGSTVVAAMTQAQVSRIVSLIGASISVRGDRRTHGQVMLRAITAVFASDVLEDGALHARSLEQSGLAYTLVRPPRLTNAAASGRIRDGSELRVGPLSSISRADLAHFMLRVAEEGLYVREAPFVVNADR